MSSKRRSSLVSRTTSDQTTTDYDTTQASERMHKKQKNQRGGGTSETANIEDLFRRCYNKATQRIISPSLLNGVCPIGKADKHGTVELTLWPFFIKEAIETNAEPSGLSAKAAYLFALLIVKRYNSGSVMSVVDTLISLITSSQEENENATVKAFEHLLVNLLQFDACAFNVQSEGETHDDRKNVLIQQTTDTTKIQFLIIAFEAFSVTNSRNATISERIRRVMENLVSIGLWRNIPKRIRDLELRKSSGYRRRWNTYSSSSASDCQVRSILEQYIPQLIGTFLDALKTSMNGKMESDISACSSALSEDMGIDHINQDSNNDEEDDENNNPMEDRKKEMSLYATETNTKPSTVSVSFYPTTLTFINTTLQFLLDLLSITSTRKYLRRYLLSINFSVQLSLSKLYKYFFFGREHTNKDNLEMKEGSSRLFVQLVSMLQDLETFGVHDLSAAPLSLQEMSQIYHERAHILQKLCHRYYAQDLSELIYASVGMICSSTCASTASSASNTSAEKTMMGDTFLKRNLDRIMDLGVLIDLAHRLRLIDREIVLKMYAKEDERRDFVTSVLLYHHTIRPTEIQMLTRLPLYPDESLLWNPYLVPPGNISSQTSSTLALPKLNLQFLTFGDYLVRMFTLLRLESAYEIRSGIVDVVKRMRPVSRPGYADDMIDDAEDMLTKIRSRTEFHGWARMALELVGDEPCKLIKVSPPKLGENIPSQVLAEITLDLCHCGENIRREWDQIGEFDNLFLVAIDAAKMTGGTAPFLSAGDIDYEGEHVLEKRMPDEEDTTFAKRFGIVGVRGCMVLEVRDENGTIFNDPTFSHREKGAEKVSASGTKRYLRVALDPAQYAADATGHGSPLGTNVYQMFNVVMRRHGRENNFKAILETIRGLMQGSGSINRSIPSWLQPVLLGYGDPSSASYTSSKMKAFATKTVGISHHATLDYGDTFIDESHLRESFPDCKINIDGKEVRSAEDGSQERRKYRIKYVQDAITSTINGSESSVQVESYPFPEQVKGNPVRFTSKQVEAIRSGLSPGLTLVVGPPGTGKTDVAVQIIANLYHSFPTQRTVIVTHSNAALNDLFEKVMARGDVDERYCLRLGSGESDLQTNSEFDFTKTGRVNYILSRRRAILEKIQLLSESLGISSKTERGADGTPSYTCETAHYFYLHHVQKRIKLFNERVDTEGVNSNAQDCMKHFPFKKYFRVDESSSLTRDQVDGYFKDLIEDRDELALYRPIELLRSQKQRINYLLTKQARIIAMTCTHCAIARSHLVELGFQYDNILFEEAGQMLDVETFIPLLLQRGESDQSSSIATRLKRVCLIGDHNQLPPVVKNMTFSKYSNFDQSLFTRLIRLGVPSIDLDKQGRSRKEIAELYSYRYNNLGNLDHVMRRQEFLTSNPGFLHTYQIINVEDFEGRGETTPTAYFYQNVGEAEYSVALFQYMVLIGYPAESISILTTYNGQKELINDILSQRCGDDTPLSGILPGAVSTVDKYQGQQNDYIILSLVRTKSVGHLRDIRRLVVAVSRARLGMYVLCRQSLFSSCHELHETMEKFSQKSNKLQLVVGEKYPSKRSINEIIPKEKQYDVEDVTTLGQIVHEMQQEMCH